LNQTAHNASFIDEQI